MSGVYPAAFMVSQKAITTSVSSLALSFYRRKESFSIASISIATGYVTL